MTENEVTALRADIARTRADLGHTVEELAERVDVKARAREAVDDAKQRSAAVAERAKLTVQRYAVQVREDPVGSTRRSAIRVRDSVRERPRAWAVTVAAVVAFALLAARRRGTR